MAERNSGSQRPSSAEVAPSSSASRHGVPAETTWSGLRSLDDSADRIGGKKTIAISLVTRRNKSDDELRGLVYSLTPRLTEGHLPWYQRPAALGTGVLGLVLVLNIIFW